MKKLFILITIIILFSLLLSADTIYLKDGKELSGDITVQANQFTVNGIVVQDERIEYIERAGQHYSAEYYRQNFSANVTKQADAYRPKKVTFKMIYQPGSKHNFNLSDETIVHFYNTYGNYLGSSPTDLETKGTYDVDGGFGLGAEFALFSTKHFELLGGLNYMFSRQINKTKFTQKIEDGTITIADNYEVDINDETFDTISFYMKPRILFSQPQPDNTVGYVSGKIGYSIVTIDIFGDDIRAENTLGAGCSFGLIINDSLDCELGWEIFAGDLMNGGEVSGRYDTSVLSLSMGLRI